MKILHPVQTNLQCLFEYLFPDQCYLCGRILQKGSEELICSWCLLSLPRTGYRSGKDHPAAQTFWGRCNFDDVIASLVYQRQNPAQKLIHGLKYHHQEDAGVFLGKILGRDMLNAGMLSEDHILVPVPLHPKKEKFRGYNQSLLICKGICKVLEVDIMTDILQRSDDVGSQTKLGRFSRYTHAEHLFRVKDIERISERKVVLIDDVITTGATLEACAQHLSKANIHQLSAAAVAFSSKS